MNLPAISTHAGVYARLRHACPQCDSLHVEMLPQGTIERENERYECANCQHLWSLAHVRTRRVNRYDAQ
jgi:hypothetical protein